MCETSDVRWSRLFADLDAQVEAAERADRAAETAELRRLELSRVVFRDRLAGAVGNAVTLSVSGADALKGSLTQVGSDWLLLDSPGAGETLVAIAAVMSVTGLPAASAPAADGVDRELGLASVLRRLARDRAAVTVVARSGATLTGTIDRVGLDFVDLAEHEPDQPRRTVDVRRVRTVALASLALVRPV
jgi:hypothetical protein